MRPGVLPFLVPQWPQIMQIGISFSFVLELTILPWAFGAGSFLSRSTGLHLVFKVFQTKVAHFCFCLVQLLSERNPTRKLSSAFQYTRGVLFYSVVSDNGLACHRGQELCSSCSRCCCC